MELNQNATKEILISNLVNISKFKKFMDTNENDIEDYLKKQSTSLLLWQKDFNAQILSLIKI